MTVKIQKIDPEPVDYLLWQSMLADAQVTGRPLVERPWHYRNIETGQKYYNLYGCVGWPTNITNKAKSTNRPGYLAVVGVIKSKRPAENALFQLLDEVESSSVQHLISEMLRLRHEWGFGLHPSVLDAWYGDQERFITPLALRNEQLIKAGGERQGLLINTPRDFYDPKVFDVYLRHLTDALAKASQRLYYGENEILRNRAAEFLDDKDPVILGMGGLIYTLVNETPWLEATRPGIFNVEEGT